jgi:hypothetical protein
LKRLTPGKEKFKNSGEPPQEQPEFPEPHRNMMEFYRNSNRQVTRYHKLIGPAAIFLADLFCNKF